MVGPWNNSVVFDRVSTVVFPISGTCRMAGLLKPLGVTVPATTTMRQLAKLLETALEGEPLIGIETQWVARAQHGDDWVTIVRGMKRFTQRENGTYQHVIDDPETGEKVTVQATILRYIPVSQVRS